MTMASIFLKITIAAGLATFAVLTTIPIKGMRSAILAIAMVIIAAIALHFAAP
jgi:hypothetical protein